MFIEVDSLTFLNNFLLVILIKVTGENKGIIKFIKYWRNLICLKKKLSTRYDLLKPVYIALVVHILKLNC